MAKMIPSASCCGEEEEAFDFLDLGLCIIIL